MRKLLKSKKIFSILIIAVCIGLFCGARGLQNCYLNQNTGSTKVAAENTKKIDNRNNTKNNLQKNTLNNSSTEKNSTVASQNKTNSKTDKSGITSGKPAINGSGTSKNNSVGTNAKSNNTGGGSGASSKVNLIFEDTVSNKKLPSVYLDIAGKTVGDVTRGYLDSQKADYQDENGYMAMIFGLWEKDKGNNSGWCFYVNGAKASVGENSYILKNGDTVVWKYLADGVNQ